ncbi:unnamed protein product, partial [Discosporangium mesarthrocarpum]
GVQRELPQFIHLSSASPPVWAVPCVECGGLKVSKDQLHMLNVKEFDQRLVRALKERKEDMDRQAATADVFSFPKIILKFGTIETVLKHVKEVFRSIAAEEGAHVSKQEFKDGLAKAEVVLDSKWCDDLVDLSDVRSTDSLGLKEFVVLLAVGRLCDAMPQISTQRHGKAKRVDTREALGGADVPPDS